MDSTLAQAILAVVGIYAAAFGIAYPGEIPRWARVLASIFGVACIAPGFWRVFSLAWGF